MPESFNRSSVSIVSTGLTDAYQAPNNSSTDRAVIISILASNMKQTGSVGVSCTITSDADAAIASIGSSLTIPANSSLEIVSNRIVLNNGEKIRVSAAEINQIDVTVSALEIT